jgi:hypothetical protein
MPARTSRSVFLAGLLLLVQAESRGQDRVPVRSVAGQPLAANVQRLVTALDYLGAPLPQELTTSLETAGEQRDALRIQKLLDPYVLIVVDLNPEVRVKVARGPADATVQQAGFTPVIIKVLNDSTVKEQLRILSPQAGPVYSGAAEAILQRQAQTELKRNENTSGATDRFLEVEMFDAQPMTRRLSGLQVEYALALIYSSEAGQLEAMLQFDVGSGTQDIGFRGEVPVLLTVRPAIGVTVRIKDYDGQPTAARLEFRDRLGKVYPPQAKRLAPDFFFQPQIYRHDGQQVLLPPGEFEVTYWRGPEYRRLKCPVVIRAEDPEPTLDFRLQRWFNPAEYGYFSGDHHIHGAGCAHYDNPTQGVTPKDMFVQVKGEGLNVGCVLTWGPCFEFQRGYFSPQADVISEPLTVLKYDLEISGFGSAALGHVCLLNLKDQTYPGSNGTKEQGWPTWTVPVMRWAKLQGGVTGYPHSAMHVNPTSAARTLIEQYDRDDDQSLSSAEAAQSLLPAAFAETDEDGNELLHEREISNAIDRAADQLPNLAIPEMNGAGAMEICVSTAEGVCDFISAMDTARIPEWNTWYHLMNCGFPLKLSGETDFPCMSSRQVGQGRVYAHLGQITALDFPSWCYAIQRGETYVSDGFAHAVEFRVDDVAPGLEPVRLAGPSEISVQASVAFAPEQPRTVAYGEIIPSGGRRMVGDTVNLHAPRTDEWVQGGQRKVELVANGQVVDSLSVPADGQLHRLSWKVPIARSSWLALRQFPQLHTNPVNVIVDNQPIRASRESALWCAATIDQLWKNRREFIAQAERPAAKASYDKAVELYRKIAAESP